MQSYKDVPTCWFWAIMFVSTVAAMVIVQTWKHIFQLPWWGVLVCMFLNLFFTLPIGVIAATTNGVCTWQPPKTHFTSPLDHPSNFSIVASYTCLGQFLNGNLHKHISNCLQFALQDPTPFSTHLIMSMPSAVAVRLRTTCHDSHDFFKWAIHKHIYNCLQFSLQYLMRLFRAFCYVYAQ
jgi:hypothetical protein